MSDELDERDVIGRAPPPWGAEITPLTEVCGGQYVLLHELGHHVDAMTRPRLGRCVRGESFAEQWANRTAAHMWEPALALIRSALTRA